MTRLTVGFGFRGVFWPVGLERGVVDFQIFFDVAVVKNEIIAGSGFKEFLL